VGKYIIQKAVNFDAVVKKRAMPLAWYANNYLAQRKWDGCCAVIDTTAEEGMSRTGEVYPSLGPATLAITNAMGPGFVCIGEAWWPGANQQSEISGDFRRMEPSDRLIVLVNDCLTEEEFAAGYSAVPYVERLARVPISQDRHWGKVPSLQPGTYGCPQAMCNELLRTEHGYDGVILRDPQGTWTAGSGTTGEIIKIKRVLSFDLRVLEVNKVTGEKTGRDVYKLVVDYRGKRLGVGSGVPHDCADVPSVGDIVEIEAMDESAHGLLREPRFKSIRFDKPEPDA
jgi:DNA ligase-1